MEQRTLYVHPHIPAYLNFTRPLSFSDGNNKILTIIPHNFDKITYDLVVKFLENKHEMLEITTTLMEIKMLYSYTDKTLQYKLCLLVEVITIKNVETGKEQQIIPKLFDVSKEKSESGIIKTIAKINWLTYSNEIIRILQNNHNNRNNHNNHGKKRVNEPTR